MKFFVFRNMGSKSSRKKIPENENDVEGSSSLQDEQKKAEESICKLILELTENYQKERLNNRGYFHTRANIFLIIEIAPINNVPKKKTTKRCPYTGTHLI